VDELLMRETRRPCSVGPTSWPPLAGAAPRALGFAPARAFLVDSRIHCRICASCVKKGWFFFF
jgi:hypothetical protein